MRPDDDAPAHLIDATRSGCDQMNLLTSALVSRATGTHDVSLLSTRVRERAQAHQRYAPLWIHPAIDATPHRAQAFALPTMLWKSPGACSGGTHHGSA